jgi:hypothetical protein
MPSDQNLLPEPEDSGVEPVFQRKDYGNRLRTGPRVFWLWRNSRDGLDRQD